LQKLLKAGEDGERGGEGGEETRSRFVIVVCVQKADMQW